MRRFENMIKEKKKEKLMRRDRGASRKKGVMDSLIKKKNSPAELRGNIKDHGPWSFIIHILQYLDDEPILCIDSSAKSALEMCHFIVQ